MLDQIIYLILLNSAWKIHRLIGRMPHGMVSENGSSSAMPNYLPVAMKI